MNEIVYRVGIVNVSDYSPFGVELDGRTISNDFYRNSFQGQEKDDEIKGEGNSVNYKYRMHDPRVGRFFAVDPVARDYPWNSSYAFSENRLLDGVEIEGLEWAKITINEKTGQFESSPDFDRTFQRDPIENMDPLLRTSSSGSNLNKEPKLLTKNEVIEQINDAVHEVSRKSGDIIEKSVVDNKGFVHTPTRSGRTFTGNQYRTVQSLEPIGSNLKKIAKKSGALGTLFDLKNIHDAYAKDNYTFGDNSKKELGGTVGDKFGWAAGAALGAEIGSPGGPIGIVIGSVVGGIAGSTVGRDIGEWIGSQSNLSAPVDLPPNWNIERDQDETLIELK